MEEESKILFDNSQLNEFQTPITKELLEQYPQEVQELRDYKVYRHISPNGKVYVGITKLSLSFRWNRGNGYKRCKLFYRAIQKYGWDNFIHEVVLEGITKSEAIYTEKYLIRWYKIHNISYNITDGGESTVGFHMPEKAKRKIAKFSSDFHKRPVLQYTIEGKFVKEYDSALDASNYLGFGKTSVSNCASGLERENTLHGYIFIYKENIDSLAQRLILCTEHWKKYKVVQYQNEKIINVFDSIRDAERITGINRVCIRKNIRGEFKHAGGFTWKKLRESTIWK